MGRVVGFLGPRGTYSEEALELVPEVAGWRRRPFPSHLEVVLAVSDRRVDAALVPVENSIDGSIDLTLDLLVMEESLLVQAEAVLPVQHVLLVHPDAGDEAPTRILSHPTALAQCRHRLRELYPAAKLQATDSTAAAARRVLRHGPGWAAIASPAAGRRFGLRVLREGVADVSENFTRFWLLGHDPVPATGWDKTSFVFSLPEDRPGALYQVLGAFAKRGLNLSRVETRPTKLRLGAYYFFLDVLGHRSDPLLAEALAEVEERTQAFRILGSYPAAYPPPPGGKG